jgi:2-phosphosulfolactate phosphatase
MGDGVVGWSGQGGFRVRFEWGPVGVGALVGAGGGGAGGGGAGATVVVVDVLRFTTAVDVAVGHGVRVLPYRWRDPSAHELAAARGAVLADGEEGRPSLSPGSLRALDPGTAVVLPSPNGATCAAIAAEAGATVVAACLRNATAVADWLGAHAGNGPIAVIACGERWPDGSLRPAVEDLLGAGAVIAGLPHGRRPSPEAELAAAAWRAAAKGDVAELVAASSSGREQVVRGWDDDLADATQVDVSRVVPVLRDGAFVAERR